MFTQCVCVLLDRAPSLGELSAALSGAPILGESPAAEGEQGWAIAGPSIDLAYRPDVGGKVRIDVVDRDFPDEMGSPDRDPMLFAAWSMGHFGPTTYPGALERAVLHNLSFPQSSVLVPRHRAFVRARVSYVLGASDDASVLPDHYDAIDELTVLSGLSLQLMKLAGALVIFNPNGELLVAPERVEHALARKGTLPVDAWVGVRRARPQQMDDWLICDTVGMGQLDVVDHQLVVPASHGSARHAQPLLLSMAAYDAARGGVVGPGDTASDEDGRSLTAEWLGEATLGPPRRVLAWVPDDVEEIPEELDAPDTPEA
jgi:hypothetical protein